MGNHAGRRSTATGLRPSNVHHSRPQGPRQGDPHDPPRNRQCHNGDDGNGHGEAGSTPARPTRRPAFFSSLRRTPHATGHDLTRRSRETRRPTPRPHHVARTMPRATTADTRTAPKPGSTCRTAPRKETGEKTRACSSTGRARRSQRRGSGFDPRQVHEASKKGGKDRPPREHLTRRRFTKKGRPPSRDSLFPLTASFRLPDNGGGHP